MQSYDPINGEFLRLIVEYTLCSTVCFRLACAAPSCYYRSSVYALEAENELWDFINKQSFNHSVCINRSPYSSQLHHDCTDPNRYYNQE